MMTMMIGIYSVCVLFISIYYFLEFDEFLNKKMWLLKNVLKYGKEGKKMKYPDCGYHLKPFTGCINCTTFWVLLIWGFIISFPIIPHLIITSIIALLADDFLNVIELLKNFINYIITKINNKILL